MAGHSQFKNIMHRKGRQDAAKAKIFTKLIREITTAARLGSPDPAANPRLRAAILAARADPSISSARASSSVSSDRGTPTICRVAPAGFVNGPSRLNAVRIPSSFRVGPACFIDG